MLETPGKVIRWWCRRVQLWSVGGAGYSSGPLVQGTALVRWWCRVQLWAIGGAGVQLWAVGGAGYSSGPLVVQGTALGRWCRVQLWCLGGTGYSSRLLVVQGYRSHVESIFSLPLEGAGLWCPLVGEGSRYFALSGGRSDSGCQRYVGSSQLMEQRVNICFPPRVVIDLWCCDYSLC